MSAGTNIGLTVEAWVDIVVKEWIKRARELGISPGDHVSADRFLHFVITQADGDPVKIQFTFDFYLKFVNWGVGRGVTIENRDTFIAAGKTSRRPKAWYDDVVPKQLTILGHLLAEKYGERTVAMVKTVVDTESIREY